MVSAPINSVQRLAQNPNIRQFLIFAIVGACATIVQYAVLASLVELAHLAKTPASIFAYGCGAVVSFLLNRRFTFGSQTDAKKTFLKFMIVNLIGLALNTAIFAALTQWGLHYLLAQCCATALVLIWNYAGARFFAFK
jgi:putative flippase GtrA